MTWAEKLRVAEASGGVFLSEVDCYQLGVQLAQLDEVRLTLAKVYASRSELDCQYSGPYSDPTLGSHCPPGTPCLRCRLDEVEAELRDCPGPVHCLPSAAKDRADAAEATEHVKALLTMRWNTPDERAAAKVVAERALQWLEGQKTTPASPQPK